MKHFVLMLMMSVFMYNVNAQDTLTYTSLQSGERPKATTEFTFYKSKDGSVYKIGDRIKIGMPSSNKTFAFITEGDGVLLPITNLTASSSGQETEIKKFQIGGTKRTGFYVSFRTKGLTGLSNYSIQFENAVASGEVKSYGMTSDEALAELKKYKDKLDLGLITQEEYDQKKAELSKIIK
jgi:hypothetical protein